MKRFKVTSPEGKSLVLTSQDDAPPSEQELEQVFSHGGVSVPEKPKDGFGFDMMKPITDTFKPSNLPSILSGQAPMQVAGGYYEQTKEPALRNIQNPVTKTLASLGIDLASGIGAEAGAVGIGRNLASRAPKLISKAEGLVPKLLPPEKGVIENQILYGGEKSYQKNLAPFIKKSKDYEDLAGKLRQSESELVGKRASIYEENPQIQDQPMFQPAMKTLEDAQSLGVIPGSKAEQMSKLITEQVDFLNALPKEKALSTGFVQARKQAFQDMAEKIYGEATAPDEKIAQKMYRDFAKSNQTALEGLSPDIKPINQKISALIGGKQSAAELGEKVATALPPSGFERFLSGTPFINKWFPVNEAKKMALAVAQKNKSVPAMSGKIESLMQKSGLYEEMGGGGLIQSLIQQALKKKK